MRRAELAFLVLLAAVACGDPTGPTLDAPVVALAAGDAHTCAADAAGRTFCWGSHQLGQLAVEGPLQSCAGVPCSLLPAPSALGVPASLLAAGEEHTCSLRPGNVPYCWGSSRFGQLGDAASVPERCELPGVRFPFPCSYVPVPAAVGYGFASIAAASGFTCGVDDAGRGYCWGRNSSGRLGTGIIRGSLAPERIALDSVLQSITTGSRHACALTASGSVYCWGSNANGRLGDGTRVDRREPVLVLPGQIVEVSAGGMDTCALNDTGALLCWGGSFAESPAPFADSLRFRIVELGPRHSCAIDTTGALYCWGANDAGQLGDGTRTDRASPVRVAGDGVYVRVAVGGRHSCAITTAGGVDCWGAGVHGQLGTGTREVVLTPTAVVP